MTHNPFDPNQSASGPPPQPAMYWTPPPSPSRSPSWMAPTALIVSIATAVITIGVLLAAGAFALFASEGFSDFWSDPSGEVTPTQGVIKGEALAKEVDDILDESFLETGMICPDSTAQQGLTVVCRARDDMHYPSVVVVYLENDEGRFTINIIH